MRIGTRLHPLAGAVRVLLRHMYGGADHGYHAHAHHGLQGDTHNLDVCGQSGRTHACGRHDEQTQVHAHLSSP